MKRTNPDTSISAYRALTPEKLNGDYKKIIEALKVLGVANYEQISDYIQCREPNVVSRRLKELEGLELIWKPGAKKLTKRGRQAYIYQLTGNFAKTEKELPEELRTGAKSHLATPTANENGFRQGNIVFLD